ncbi:MAG: ABC transporter permease [Planctomycetes bacterium]|jgi:ABC-type lipoprotein release transport system permease subunit|nr:ABC transporter permease [Planctomycetota bacterium]MBT6453384.1 ABC transporter permease [Planctomycetota bacterium]MBT6542131.1 ABC transporter permease [Planctomycetota bacterium]MBT6783456.1 ABC transporter permease [Planctomycetota bacterium]MBT6967309.1 ABC transporter permease [Planctomycetota bacterium]
MALPTGYTTRNLMRRRSQVLFTALGIAFTTAVLCGILSLRNGFEQLFRPLGAEEVAVYLRIGATSEGDSGIPRESARIIIKERPEILRDDQGNPLAAAECFLALYMEKMNGGLVNAPLRGIEEASLKLHPTPPRLLEGRWPDWGSDEVVVGRPLVSRLKNCSLGDTLTLNTTPFAVVGVYEFDNSQGSEIWGPVERMLEALDRPVYNRVIARVHPDLDFAMATEQLEEDPRLSFSITRQSEYLAAQTTGLSTSLLLLSIFLTIIMGSAAVIGTMNTMLATVASRTHEIGILLAIGYSRIEVFLAFLLESAQVGLIGGMIGLLMVAPFHGIETGAANFNTFTDISFSFQLSPTIALTSVLLSFLLGLIGGAIPAWIAANRSVVDAIRR